MYAVCSLRGPIKSHREKRQNNDAPSNSGISNKRTKTTNLSASSAIPSCGSVQMCANAPSINAFSRHTESSFDKTGVIQDFDRLLLCRRTYKVVVPESLITSVLYDLHGSLVNGHRGMTTCRSHARNVYWWKGMHKDITRWINACLTCRRRKPGKPTVAGETGTMDLPPRPFHTIHIDHSGP